MDAVANILEECLPRTVPRSSRIFNSADREAVGGYLGMEFDDGETEVSRHPKVDI